tara:strand:+ start:349 stop:1395 length:1047 start_codon:yes stop_codon:yes gene_type:complete
LNIYNVPETRRYWVVRAEGGLYYDHFIKHRIVALGHLNCLKVADTEENEWFSPDEGELSSSFLKHNESKDIKRQRTSVHLAQIRSFVYEMSIGDWVLTVGERNIRFGRILSHAFIRKGDLTVVYDPESGRKVDMDYDLRRDIQWGPSLLRKNLPYGLITSLKANQTLFCLDKNWEAVYHSLYPCFMRKEKLYLSARINTQESIKNYNVAALFNILNEVEVIAKEFAIGNSLVNVDRDLEKYVDEDSLTITTKAQFHSPGEIWNTISDLAGNISIDGWAAYAVATYSMIFGNQKLGFDGILDLETRKKLWDLVLERLKSNKAEKIKESLKIELPSANTTKLEDSSNDQE